MGTLSQVNVIRQHDKMTFAAFAWVIEDGLFDVFWREGGKRHNGRFTIEGRKVWPDKAHKMEWLD